MFERFTDRARHVLVLAQEEARLLNHNFIGTEHILLGLVREGQGVAAGALDELGIRLEDVRERVEQTIGPAGMSPTGAPPFTPRAKKVLELSLREALQLGHNDIGTEHILLGLVREGEGVAAQVLVSLGADLSQVRQQVMEVLTARETTLRPAMEVARAALRPMGPRCGRCGSDLTEPARYRAVDVPSDKTGVEERSVQATLVYCSRCGAVLSAATGLRGAGGPPTSGRAGVVFSGGGVISARAARPEPSRRFPDELLGPVDLGAVAEEAKVDLAYRRRELIEGTVGGDNVRLSGDVGSSHGSMKGTWGTAKVAVDNWRIAHSSRTDAGPVTATMSGRFGDDAFELKSSFQLRPDYLFESGEIFGDLCGRELRAAVQRAGGGLGSTSTVAAEGTLGEEAFEVFVAVAEDLTSAIMRGSFGGHSVALDASREDPSASVRVFGAYAGPAPFLALLMGSLAHFF